MASSIRNRKCLLIAAAAAGAIANTAAFATDYSWLPFATGTYTWTTTSNWSPTGAPLGAAGAGDNATLSGPIIGGPLNVNLPGNVFITNLTMGGTDTAKDTTIIGTGGTMFFDPAATINSLGIAGALNSINAPITMNANLTLAATSTNSLAFGGVLSQAGGDRTLTNTLPTGTTLSINGGVNITEPGSGLTVGRNFNIQGTGTTIFNAAITDGDITGGKVSIGNTNAGSLRPTVIFNVANSFTGTLSLNRGTLLLNNASAFVGSNFQMGGQTNAFQRMLVPMSDMTVAENIALTNNLTVTGTHSLNVTGFFWMSSNRFLVNNIATDSNQALTLSTGVGICSSGDTLRTLVLDGSGHTILNCNVYNHRNPAFAGASGDAANDTSATGNLQKNGTGILSINGTTSTYKGTTVVTGGVLEFGVSGSYGATSGITVNPGGAVGLLTGSLGDATFLGKFAATAAATSTGALALASPDASTNIDFTAAPLSDPKAVGMSIGAVSSGVTYTGTINPPAAGYHLGGGGTLTLSGNNALTGGSAVAVNNGGTVALTGSNNYSGATSVTGHWILPTQVEAADSQAGQNDLNASPAALRVNTTLAVSQLADGGSPSSIGSSGKAAANLILDGATLKYIGSSASSTDRSMTIGANGATLDASGASPAASVTFRDPAAIAYSSAADRDGNSIATNSKLVGNVANTSDLAVGMTVSGTNIPAGATIIGLSTGTIVLSGSSLAAGTANLSFPVQNRTLALTGTNTGNNTVANAIGNATTGTVTVTKTGAGRWIINGNNSYAGGTSVSAGTLGIGTIGTVGTGTLATSATGFIDVLTGRGNNALSVATLSLAAGTTMDMNDNDMIVNNSTYATITGLIKAARNGGSWDKPGITSSAARTASPKIKGLGVLTGAQYLGLGTTTFDGTSVLSTDTLEKFTWYGDMNFDGKVNFDDYQKIDNGFQSGGSDWFHGDLNYDGKVDFDDYQLIDGAFNQQSGTLRPAERWLGGDGGQDMSSPPLQMVVKHFEEFGQPYANAFLASVPEPSGVLLAAGAVAFATTSRRRKRR